MHVVAEVIIFANLVVTVSWSSRSGWMRMWNRRTKKAKRNYPRREPAVLEGKVCYVSCHIFELTVSD